MKQSIRLEIVVTFQRKRFKAVSPSFPNCHGTGKSEAEAIEKLNTAISKSIADVAKKALTQMVESDASVTEPLLGTAPKSQGTRHVYELDASAFGGRPFNTSKLSYPTNDMYKVPPEQDIQRLLSTLDQDISGIRSLHTDDDDDFDIEGMAFGFPLNLN